MGSSLQNKSSAEGPLTRVFSFNWDLSSGYKKHGPGFMTNIFQHVGILAYGTLYEYSEEGILRTEVPPNEVPDSACFAGDLSSCQELGKTSRSKEAFERWLEEQQKGDFEPSRYNLTQNNCVSFAIRACEFLGVPPSAEWTDVAKYGNWTPRISTVMTSSSANVGSILSTLSGMKVNQSK